MLRKTAAVDEAGDGGERWSRCGMVVELVVVGEGGGVRGREGEGGGGMWNGGGDGGGR